MEDLAEFALKQCKEAEYAEVRIENQKEETFVAKNGIPELGSFAETKGIGIRVLINGCLGFVSTNILNKENVKSIVSKAIKMAKVSKKVNKSPIVFSKENIHLANIRIKPKKDSSSMQPAEKIKFITEIDKDITSLPFKVPARQFSFSNYDLKKIYLNSEGSKIKLHMPRIDFFWFLTVAAKGKTRQRYIMYNETQGLEALKKWNLNQSIVSEAKAMHNNIVNGRKCPSGVMDVIAGPEVVGIAVHESTGHPYEADRILGREAAQAGESFVTKEMLGTRIGSENVTVVEDPTIEHTPGFYLYDDEGVKARKRLLIKKGMINELLLNRETAKILGVKSNAAARAVSYDREPIVRMANTYMQTGDWGRDEIIEDTKHGIYVKNFMEWNIDDVRFNQKYVGAEAYLIKNGEIKGPIVNPVIEVTTPTFYKAVDACAKDIELYAGPCGKGEPMQAIPVSMGGPTIRLKKLKIR
ncbi:TldD/PmbA family protein [Candidatus Woesearchaeota archaeon]|nr:TldD/PmbA family protein [Candidatus Woesearchaeota archaeon]